MQIIRKQFFREKEKGTDEERRSPWGVSWKRDSEGVFSINLLGSRGTSDGYIYLSDNRVGDTLSL